MGLFALFFIIILSVTLVAGSFLIWKSKLPEREKMVGIIVILALFCMVTIVNEAAKSGAVEPRFNVAEFEKSFFNPPAGDLKTEYDLPLIQDYREFVLSAFDRWDPEDLHSFQFALLYHEGRVGKSLAAQMYTEHLQKHKIPTLYINIKTPQTDVFTFAGMLKIANLNVLDESIQKYNSHDKVPVIFIDNIHNAFDKEGCSLCTYLKGLYDNKQVNIILITNDARARESLQTTEAFSRRMSFLEFKERPLQEITDYLTQKINPLITKEENKFTAANIPDFLSTIGFNFEVLYYFKQNQNKYESLQDFIRRYTEEQASKISNIELLPFFKCIASLNKTSNNNNWLHYGALRKACDASPRKIDEAVNTQLLIKKNSLYKFRNNLVFHAIALSGVEPKKDL